MPAALDVDREAVKTLAMAVGVREAARRMGLDENTVRQWSAREGWLRDAPRSQPLPPTVLQPVTGVTKSPSQAMGETLKELAGRTRLGHAKAQAKVADLVSEMDAQEVLMSMPAILQGVKASSILHGWTAGSSGQPSVRLDLVSGSNGTAMRLDIGASEAPEDDED